MTPLARLYWTVENAAAVALFPSTALHELAHATAFASLGHEATISWSDLRFELESSSVSAPGDAPIRDHVLAGLLAPFVLLVPALLTTLAMDIVPAPRSLPGTVAVVALGVQGFGFALQAGPSGADIEYAHARVTRTGRFDPASLSARAFASAHALRAVKLLNVLLAAALVYAWLLVTANVVGA
jgi:hypothetical protein